MIESPHQKKLVCQQPLLFFSQVRDKFLPSVIPFSNENCSKEKEGDKEKAKEATSNYQTVDTWVGFLSTQDA